MALTPSSVLLIAYFKVEYQLKQFAWIMEETFNHESAESFLTEKAQIFVAKCYKYFKLGAEKESQSLMGRQPWIPGDMASLAAKLLFVLSRLDQELEANIVMKMETTMTNEEAALAAKSPLPSMLILGK